MKWSLNLDIPPLLPPITHADNLLLIGSCFTEHIADRLATHKFSHLANPHGILFNPISVAQSLESYINGKTYTESNLFYLNELWNSHHHHSRFSHPDKEEALRLINTSQAQAAQFLTTATRLIITLGSAFQYYYIAGGIPVANNHRAPAQWYEKRMLTTANIVDAMQEVHNLLSVHCPNLQIIYTVSPVRHIRDGVIANNHSKARLLDAVHTLCAQNPGTYYFPAYEIVIDILRDYRFYDIDMVHPNYLATQHVWEQFITACIHPDSHKLLAELKEINIALNHHSRFPQTEAHTQFLKKYYHKVLQLQNDHPTLNFTAELSHFNYC